MEDMVEVLRNFAIFSGLTEEELEPVIRITSCRIYAKRTFVFMEGEVREAVFFIQKGVIKAFKIDNEGNEQVISLLRAGDMFPHVGFFDDAPYPATTQIMQDASLLVIRITDFEHLMLENPQISLKVMKILGQKIVQLQQRLQEFISGDVHRRVIRSLLRLAAENGQQQGEGVYIAVPLTNQDFANMVGTSRESISRTLNLLKKEGILSIDRHGILIHDFHTLKEV